MIKEKFKGFTNITLFSGFDHVVAEGGFYALRNSQISILDTVMNPDAWTSAEATVGYKRFDEGATLTVAFGKPFSSERADTAKVRFCISRTALRIETSKGTDEYPLSLPSEGHFTFSTKSGKLVFSAMDDETVLELSHIPTEMLCGYMGMTCEGGEFWMSLFEADADMAPLSAQEHDARLKRWRHAQLDKVDEQIDALEEYAKAHPELLYQKHADLFLPTRLVDAGEELTVTVRVYGEPNAAFAVTHNSMRPKAQTVSYKLDLKEISEGVYGCDIAVRFDIPGNTRIELWANGDKLVRSVAVLGKGYMAVIPWIGSNTPFLDEELHRHDIGSDYWMSGINLSSPERTLRNTYKFVRCGHRYGDRAASCYSSKSIVPNDEADNLFALDHDSKVRGFRQYARICKIIGMPEVELAASYTADGDALVAMEECGIKAMTSLCLWQNWQDGGWLINHWGASNQPYHPASEDYRRNGEKRDIMCFTMGNSSDTRNYSIMSMDSCPTLVIPGERYFDHYVEHFHAQRFYDAFEQYIVDAKNSDELLTVSLCIEAFRGKSDWNAVNEMALRYIVERAMDADIVFTSAADVADYHKRKDLAMQKAYFCQPDFYYGYHNGELPGRAPDRIEVNTPEYLAVIHKGKMLPAFFYDYTQEWEEIPFDDSGRNIFGLVNPDTNDTSLYSPPQPKRDGISITYEYKGSDLVIHIDSQRAMHRMVTGVFDIPYAQGFTAKADKADVVLNTVTDRFTGNTHLFIDLGAITIGKTNITISLEGTKRIPVDPELKKDLFAAMWFGDHAYMRSLDMHTGISISIAAPESAYIIRQDGERITPENGMLRFTVNCAWYDEAPLLYGYAQDAFAKALADATVENAGKSTTSRWSWEVEGEE